MANKKKKNVSTDEETVETKNSKSTKGKQGKESKNLPFKKAPGANDINWWIQDSAAGRQAAAIPFVYPTGINTFNKTGLPAPVFMRLNTRLIPGINTGPNSPFNQQMRKITANMVQKLGGSGEANAANVGLYLVGIGNIYAFIAMCKRLYGTIKLFTPENIFMPDGLIEGQGFDPTDLRANAQALRVAINYWIDRINTSFAMPNDMGFVKRWEQLLGNYYSDFQALRGQVYAYNCYDYYIYDEANSKLVSTPLPMTGGSGTYHSVDDLINFGNSLLYPFMESENMNMVSARIRRAWTDLYGMENMDEFYPAPITYNPEILYEIHNTSVVGALAAGYDITEVNPGTGTSYLANSLEVGSTDYEIPKNAQYIDMPLPVETVTPELVMLGSRGLVTEEIVTESGVNHLMITSAGTDVVSHINIYGWDANQQIAPVSGATGVGRYRKIGNTLANYAFAMGVATNLSKFDWAPNFSWIVGSAAYVICDTTYIGLVPDDQIAMLHRTALASAFNAKDVSSGQAG